MNLNNISLRNKKRFLIWVSMLLFCLFGCQADSLVSSEVKIIEIKHQVSYLYQSILQREADSTGFFNYQKLLLEEQITIQEAALAFGQSDEFKNNFIVNKDLVAQIETIFLHYLNRLPNKNERAIFIGDKTDKNTNLNYLNCIQYITVLQEFENIDWAHFAQPLPILKMNTLLNEKTKLLFKNLFNRLPSAIELDHWKRKFGNGVTYKDAIVLQVQSDEFFETYFKEKSQQEQIIGIFQALLKRPPKRAEVTHFSSILQNNKVDKKNLKALTQLLNLPEYNEKCPYFEIEEIYYKINVAYRLVFGRGVDALGFRDYGYAILTNTLNFKELTYQLGISNEYTWNYMLFRTKQQKINLLFRSFLKRKPSKEEIEKYKLFLRNTNDPQAYFAVLRALIESQEFSENNKKYL